MEAPKSPFDLTKKVADGQHHTTEEAMAVEYGAPSVWPRPDAPGLFPDKELPAHQTPAPFKLGK